MLSYTCNQSKRTRRLFQAFTILALPGHAYTASAQEPIVLEPIADAASQPETSAMPIEIPRAAWGFADLHNHQFAHLAFGGGLLAGASFHPDLAVSPEDGIELALACCSTRGDECLSLDACPQTGLSLHGDCGKEDWIGEQANDVPNLGFPSNEIHPGSGFPDFQGWPFYTSVTHQKVYYEWLRRAWEGGLRLIVMLAVDSRALCRLTEMSVPFTGAPYPQHPFPCDDTESVHRQIRQAKLLEEYIGRWDGGWYQIADSAEDARRIIDDGNLAVVLGIETGTLFDCSFHPWDQEQCDRLLCELGTCSGDPSVMCGNNARCADAGLGECIKNTCSTDSDCPFTGHCMWVVEQELRALQRLGVRHVFPIHNVNNAFGGTAVFDNKLVIGSALANHAAYHVWDCSSLGYEKRVSFSIEEDLLIAYLNLVDPRFPPLPDFPEGAACNSDGLFDRGVRLASLLMDLRMIIDVDHLSRRARDEMLLVAENSCYPVVSSHSGFNALYSGVDANRNHEGQLTSVHFGGRCSADTTIGCSADEECGHAGAEGPCEGDVERIRRLGGLVAPLLKHGATRAVAVGGDVRVDNTCAGSSRSWAQSYQYAVNRMGGGPVAIGSDFNGMIGHLKPRYGDFGCAGEDESLRLAAPSEVYSIQTYNSGRLCEDDTDCPGERCHLLARQCVLPACSGPDIHPSQCGEIIPGTGELGASTTGSREFTLDEDGVAHVGLLPDFIADLDVVGLDPADLRPLLLSADAYVSMWERIEGVARLVHVDPEVRTCGGGTAQSPYQTLARGLEALKPGGIMVASPGTYRKPIVIGESVVLVSRDLVEKTGG